MKSEVIVYKVRISIDVELALKNNPLNPSIRCTSSITEECQKKDK
jgi:hypothetical protein